MSACINPVSVGRAPVVEGVRSYVLSSLPTDIAGFNGSGFHVDIDMSIWSTECRDYICLYEPAQGFGNNIGLVSIAEIVVGTMVATLGLSWRRAVVFEYTHPDPRDHVGRDGLANLLHFESAPYKHYSYVHDMELYRVDLDRYAERTIVPQSMALGLIEKGLFPVRNIGKTGVFAQYGGGRTIRSQITGYDGQRYLTQHGVMPINSLINLD